MRAYAIAQVLSTGQITNIDGTRNYFKYTF